MKLPNEKYVPYVRREEAFLSPETGIAGDGNQHTQTFLVASPLAASAQALTLGVLTGWVCVVVISYPPPDPAGTYAGCRRHEAV